LLPGGSGGYALTIICRHFFAISAVGAGLAGPTVANNTAPSTHDTFMTVETLTEVSLLKSPSIQKNRPPKDLFQQMAERRILWDLSPVVAKTHGAHE
jgi:hypothetical protein